MMLAIIPTVMETFTPSSVLTSTLRPYQSVPSQYHGPRPRSGGRLAWSVLPIWLKGTHWSSEFQSARNSYPQPARAMRM
jgi:hypothetical protein